MANADVVVIGGGIAGVSSAAHLAAAGRRVVLVERTTVAAGASGRNSGVVQHPFDPVLVALHLETLDLYRELAAASDGGFRLPAEPAGLLNVTHDPGVAQRRGGRIGRSGLQSHDGRRRDSLGSTFLDVEPDAPALVGDLVARGATFVPAIGSASPGAVRACARPLSADGRPLIGRIPWVEGMWVVAGHGPWGISTGPASGRLVADLINGTLSAPPATLDAVRFGGSPGR
ncbi:MAG: NAD(P)/FAD-dependent oxidoreductase [Candidatus Limnocylindrales bacterium]